MVTRRQKRVEDLLRDEIGKIVRKDVDGFPPEIASFTRVAVSKDFSHARVFVSFLDHKRVGSVISKLRRAEGYIRSELNKVIRMKRIPKLLFEVDKSIEKAFEMDELLTRISVEQNESDK